MLKKIVVAAALTLSVSACASDFRSLRFASTPTQAAQPGPAESTTRDVREAPYALTGRQDPEAARPQPSNLQFYVVGNPHFRPGK